MLGNAIAARFAFRFGSLTLLICGRVVAFVGATALMLWFLVGRVGVWAMFLPIAFTEIGDGMSQPSTMAAGLSIHIRLAGTASGLMGFLQMVMAAGGSFIVALLPQNSAFAPISVFAGFVSGNGGGKRLGWRVRELRRMGETWAAPAVQERYFH